MTPSDDEVLARLRAALHTVADRTPISGGRLDDAWAAPAAKQARPVVAIVSAAAAVAAIAAVTAVVASTHAADSRNVLPAAGGGVGVSGSAAAQSATPTIMATPSPGLAIPTPTITATPSPLLAADGCVPVNDYVIASPSEVAGLTYLLPTAPTGYVLNGAWGTISSNQCADSVTWYVEYDPVSGTTGSGDDTIQLTVTKVGGDSIAGEFAHATPVASTQITVNGVDGLVFDKDSNYAVIGWTTGGAAITLSGAVSNGDVTPLVQVADSLILVSPNDPRIVAPADCRVPPGNVCGGDTDSPSPSSSSSASSSSPSSIPTPWPTASGAAGALASAGTVPAASSSPTPLATPSPSR
jgi:hypothetical protein